MKYTLDIFIRTILKNSILSLFILFVVLLGLFPGISNFQLDASSDSLVLENDPDLKTYREMGNLFSDSDFLIVTLRPNDGIFNIKIQKAWENAVEKKILDYTKEIYVKGEVLYIKVSNPILKQEILYSKQKVINLINEELEKDLIKKIVLK